MYLCSSSEVNPPTVTRNAREIPPGLDSLGRAPLLHRDAECSRDTSGRRLRSRPQSQRYLSNIPRHGGRIRFRAGAEVSLEHSVSRWRRGDLPSELSPRGISRAFHVTVKGFAPEPEQRYLSSIPCPRVLPSNTVLSLMRKSLERCVACSSVSAAVPQTIVPKPCIT